jgi:hypothetical protein
MSRKTFKMRDGIPASVKPAVSHVTRKPKRLTPAESFFRSEAAAMGYVSTLLRIQKAFEQAGVHFIDDDESGGIGVRLQKKKR